MPKFKIDVNGSQYEVDAPDEKSLPEIVDTIAKENPVSEVSKPNIEGKDVAMDINRPSLLDQTTDKLKTAAMLGPMSAAGGTKSEEAYQISKDSLPTIGQVLGGATGGLPGAIAGSSAGVTAKKILEDMHDKKETGSAQMIKDLSLLGGMGIGKNKELAEQTATTAVIESLARGTSSLLFKRARADEVLRNGIGKVYGTLKGVLKGLPDEVGTATENITNGINNIFKDVYNQSGPINALKNKWLKLLEQYKGKTIPPRVLIELEDNLNDTLNFVSKEAPFSFKAKNRTMEVAGKKWRTFISDAVDEVATKNGIEEFPILSKQVAKNLEIVKEKSQNKLMTLLEGGVLASSIYMTTGSKLLAGLATPALFFATEPAIQKALFTIGEKSGLGRSLTLGLSEIVRRGIENKNKKKY